MYNPADLTQDKIMQLAQKMQNPEARKKAAYHLASTVGPSPDEAQELGQMMQPQGGQQQPQLPPEMQMQGGMQPQLPQMMQPSPLPGASELLPGSPSPQPMGTGAARPSTLYEDREVAQQYHYSVDEDQQATQQATLETQKKIEMAEFYDQMGLTGADPQDIWGKAAIAQEFVDKQSMLQQQGQQLQQQQQPQAMPGGAPQAPMPPQPYRQQMPNQNFDDYVGGKKSWSF